MLRQKKVSKEKATWLPLISSVPHFRRGLTKGAPAPSSTCGIPAAPLTGYSRRKLRYSARHTGLNPYLRQIFFALAVRTRQLLRLRRFPRAMLIVIHKCLRYTVIPAGIAGIQKPWMAIPKQTANSKQQISPYGLLSKIKHSHPCVLDPGNPCREDVLKKTCV